MIEAKVVCDSALQSGSHRLTTMVLTYPRCIHSEFMTHRTYSRNASSSRAIPVKKSIEKVLQEPFIPVWWGKNEPGMQAHAEVDDTAKAAALSSWLTARDAAVEHARHLVELGLHKQLVNRLLEPWSWITVVCTGTEWQNFFNLRDHPDAEPHMRLLAQAMKRAYTESKPTRLDQGQWHLPFITEAERTAIHADRQPDHWMPLIKSSVARCARVSYLNHDGTNPDPEKDRALHDFLVTSGHMSPLEHQARPHPYSDDFHLGNLVGWVQYRSLIPNQAVFVPPEK